MAPRLGGIVADMLSWRAIFVVYGALSLLIFLWFARAIRDAPTPSATSAHARGPRAHLRAYWRLLTQPAPRCVMIAVFLEGLFFFGAFAYLGAFLRDRYHLLYIVIGLLLGAFGLGSLIYSRATRWLVQRLGERGMVLIGGALSFSSYVLIALFHLWPLFIVLAITLGLGFYMLHGTLQTQATELAPDARGTAVSLFAFNLFLGQGIGAAVLAPLIDLPGGYDITLYVCAVGVLALAGWFALAMRPSRDAPTETLGAR